MEGMEILTEDVGRETAGMIYDETPFTHTL
jgi:hypothetical protein